MTAKTSQTNTHRRREAALRALECRTAANRRGLRRTTPLIDKLAELHARYGRKPYPSQEYLATELGVVPRTVRYWLTELEAAGIILVYRSKPYCLAGVWARHTNRYLLTSGIARRDTGIALPTPYRITSAGHQRGGDHRSESPRGKRLPLSSSDTSRGGRLRPPAPPRLGVNTRSNPETPAPAPTHTLPAAAAERPPAEIKRVKAELSAMRAALAAQNRRH